MKKIVSLLLILTFIGCKEDEPTIHRAEAKIYFTNQSENGRFILTNDLYGTAVITEQNGIVKLEILTSNPLEDQRNAVHIHQGNCEDPGMHWNRGTDSNFCREMNLGKPWGRPKAGDVGNIRRGEDSLGRLSIESDIWSISAQDESNIIGLPIVVHENFEDFPQECFENHSHVHNNPKIACGTIELILND